MMKWLLIACVVGLAGSAIADPKPATDPKPARIDIQVTKRGFEPGEIAVRARIPVILVFTRKTEATCAKSVVLKLDDGKQIERELPLDQAVEIAVTFPKAGKLGYACSMDMMKGVIVVQ